MWPQINIYIHTHIQCIHTHTVKCVDTLISLGHWFGEGKEGLIHLVRN